jgi:hypothetical protein
VRVHAKVFQILKADDEEAAKLIVYCQKPLEYSAKSIAYNTCYTALADSTSRWLRIRSSDGEHLTRNELVGVHMHVKLSELFRLFCKAY